MGLHSYTGIFTTYVKQMGRIIRRHSDVSAGVYGLYSSTTATKVDLRNCITMCLWPRRQEPVLPAAGSACRVGVTVVVSPLLSLMQDQVEPSLCLFRAAPAQIQGCPSSTANGFVRQSSCSIKAFLRAAVLTACASSTVRSARQGLLSQPMTELRFVQCRGLHGHSCHVAFASVLFSPCKSRLVRRRAKCCLQLEMWQSSVALTLALQGRPYIHGVSLHDSRRGCSLLLA